MQGQPEVAGNLFGGRLELAVRYAELLCEQAVPRGLLGPREAERVWTRHLINSAAIAPLLAIGSTLLDLGSGAGVPGVPLAIARPDLSVVLLDSVQRRVDFLREVVLALGLEDVRVVHARAEELAGRLRTDAVVARAVAPMDRLVRWGWPLVRPGGQLLAIKGASVAAELSGVRWPTDRIGAPEVLRCGAELSESPTTVVRLRRRVRRRTGSGGGPS